MSLDNARKNHHHMERDTSYQLLLATLDTADDGIIVISKRGRVQHLNQGAEKILGYSSVEMVGENVSLLMPEIPGSSIDESILNRVVTGKSEAPGGARRILVRDKTGRIFSIQLSLGEFHRDSGNVFFSMAGDYAEQSVLQAELDKEREKNRCLLQKLHDVHQASRFDELVTAMSHEINQPLMAITIYADVTKRILVQDSEDLAMLESNLEKISIQALKASDVIKKLRNIAPKSKLISGASNIDDLFVEIKNLIGAESEEVGCTIRWSCEDELPLVCIDVSQVQHVVIMLLRNSFGSFSKDAKTKVVSVTTSKLSANFVQVAIEDNGQCLDDVDVDTLYHSFSSNKATEAGLSLSMCHTIVVNHGGRIWHEPVADGGNRYVFTLPVSTQRNIHEAC